jgi:hypothetical protein
MTTANGLRKPLPSAEALLERRFERDSAVHASMKEGRSVWTVAKEFGLTRDECREIYGSIEFPNVMLSNLAESRYKARKRAEAAADRAAKADAWPPARIRNLLMREFGIPEDRLGDAAVIAETVSRSEILAVPRTHAKTADAIAAYLADAGHVLRA